LGIKHVGNWNDELDMSGSRDVIGHVTNCLAISHFLLVIICK